MASNTSVSDMLNMKISLFMRVYKTIAEIMERRAQG